MICMGESDERRILTRTSAVTIGPKAGPSSWAAAVSRGAESIGGTDKDGVAVEGKSYLPGDLWATVAFALGIPLRIRCTHPSWAVR